MQIERIAIDKLRPAAYNPRKDLKPGDAEYEALKRSVERWDIVQPLVWNKRSGNLVGGHQRLKVLKARGDTDVDVSVVDLDDQDEAALNIALNKIGGDWDIKGLADVLSELDGNGFDVTLTGFDFNELESLLVDKDDDEAPLPEPPANPDSKLGEVYGLGPHRLMCGDSTNAEHVATLLAGVEPHLMVTDPPYGVEYDASWRDQVLGEGNRATGVVQNDDNADWREAWALFPGDVAYVWHADMGAALVASSLEACGFGIRCQIIWAKQHFVVGRGHYHTKHEPCWYAVRSTGHWQGDRKQATVWDIDKPAKSETGHSTQKPIECMRRPIVNNSSPGQAVYDPFLGSGTTLIAAEQTGRICYGMELDPGYCDVIRGRYEAFVGTETATVGV